VNQAFGLQLASSGRFTSSRSMWERIWSLLQHKTRSVFDRYNIVSDQDLIQAFNAVDNYRVQATESKVAPIKKAEGE
jgi:hypothetical protein